MFHRVVMTLLIFGIFLPCAPVVEAGNSGALLLTGNSTQFVTVAADHRIIRDTAVCADNMMTNGAPAWEHIHYGATDDCITEPAGTRVQVLGRKKDATEVRICSNANPTAGVGAFCADGWVASADLAPLH